MAVSIPLRLVPSDGRNLARTRFASLEKKRGHWELLGIRNVYIMKCINYHNALILEPEIIETYYAPWEREGSRMMKKKKFRGVPGRIAP